MSLVPFRGFAAAPPAVLQELEWELRRKLRVVPRLFLGSRTTLALITGLIGLVAPAGVKQAAQASAETHTLTFFHTHTKESATITFWRDGRYDDEALSRLNWFLRDWRVDEPAKMDPHLFDILWEVYRESGSREPINIISAYRSPATNAMLRGRSKAVSEHSQHMLGKAMDIRLPDETRRVCEGRHADAVRRCWLLPVVRFRTRRYRKCPGLAPDVSGSARASLPGWQDGSPAGQAASRFPRYEEATVPRSWPSDRVLASAPGVRNPVGGFSLPCSSGRALQSEMGTDRLQSTTASLPR